MPPYHGGGYTSNPICGCGESRSGGHIYGNMAVGPGWEVGAPVGVSGVVVGVVMVADVP